MDEHGWLALFGIVPALLAAWKGFWDWRRSKNERVSEARERLDKATGDYMDRLERENDRLAREGDGRLRAGELWERRARRADNVAHNLKHMLKAERLRTGNKEPVPEIPLLEDPLD